MPAVRENLTPKYYVDQAISYHVNESSFSRLDSDEKLKLDEKDSLCFKSTLTSPKRMIETPTQNYVDSLHENSRNSQDLSLVFNDQDYEFDEIKLSNLDSVSVHRYPSSDNELS